MNRRGFTLIEMMAVVAIIGILLGMVMSAAAGSIRVARRNKTAAVVQVVQQGVETFRAQKDRWPGNFATSGSGAANTDGVGGRHANERRSLDAMEVRAAIREIVEETCLRANPMLDPSGLYVSRDSGEDGHQGLGLDFMDAVRGTPDSPEKMKIAEMYFGYPDEKTGFFRRLKMTYIKPTDSVEVSQ